MHRYWRCHHSVIPLLLLASIPAFGQGEEPTPTHAAIISTNSNKAAIRRLPAVAANANTADCPGPEVCTIPQLLEDVNAFLAQALQPNDLWVPIINTDGTHGYEGNDPRGANPAQVEALAHHLAEVVRFGHLVHLDPYLTTWATDGTVTGLPMLHEQTRQSMNALGARATPLLPGGRLQVGADSITFDWVHPGGVAHDVRLMGTEWPGSMLSLGQVPGTGKPYWQEFLDQLAMRGCNFTRVWLIEQWQHFTEGGLGTRIPFMGPDREWDLETLRPAFIQRLVDFVGYAAQKGIVVQISLFDKNGLWERWADGGWLQSPFNATQPNANNINGFIQFVGNGNQIPSAFLATGGAIAAVNENLVVGVVGATAGFGNVMYEIMNEPDSSHWAPTPPAGALRTWHAWVADVVETAVPGPTAVIQTTPDPPYAVGVLSLTVNFDGSQSLPLGADLTFAWDFDNDGTFDDTGPIVSHEYVAQGTGVSTFVCRMRVSDEAGLFDEAQVTVVIDPKNSTFTSHDIPKQMVPGEVRTVHVTVQNSGQTTWPQDYLLVGHRDSSLFGVAQYLLGQVVAPGQSKTFTFSITAPPVKGIYVLGLNMREGGIVAAAGFGEFFTKEVTVTFVK